MSDTKAPRNSKPLSPGAAFDALRKLDAEELAALRDAATEVERRYLEKRQAITARVTDPVVLRQMIQAIEPPPAADPAAPTEPAPVGVGRTAWLDQEPKGAKPIAVERKT